MHLWNTFRFGFSCKFSLSRHKQFGGFATISALRTSRLRSDSELQSVVKESDWLKCCWNLGSSNCSLVNITQLLSHTNSSRVSPRKFFIVVNAYTSHGTGTFAFCEEHPLFGSKNELFSKFRQESCFPVFSLCFPNFPRNNFLNHFMTDNPAVSTRVNEGTETIISHSHGRVRCFPNESRKTTAVETHGQRGMTNRFMARADLCSLTIINYIICIYWTNVVIDKGSAMRPYCAHSIKIN